MSTDNDADEQHVAHGPDDVRREFGAPVELRENEPSNNTHLTGNLAMLEQAVDEDIAEADEALAGAHAATLEEIADQARDLEALCRDLRPTLDDGYETAVGDAEVAFGELAEQVAILADAVEDDRPIDDVRGELAEVTTR